MILESTRSRVLWLLDLIASFYLVDRGLWHRLPGISGFGTGLLFLSRASVGSDANGHTTVGSLWVEHRSAGLVRSNGSVPIWKNRPEMSLRVSSTRGA